MNFFGSSRTSFQATGPARDTAEVINNALQPERPVTAKYRHVKTGDLYEVTAEAVMESNVAPVVVYRHIETGVFWVRPLKEFYDGRFAPKDDG